MDALSLDPKTHLDLTNKRNKKSQVSKDQKCAKYLCPLLLIKLKQTQFELDSPVLSVVVWGFL